MNIVTLQSNRNFFCLYILMLVNLILSIFNTTELYSVFVNNYLVDHSDYTNVSDHHICLKEPFLRKAIEFLEHTNKILHL